MSSHLAEPPTQHLIDLTFTNAPAARGQTGAEVTGSARWPLERVLFALAGSMTLVSVVLVATVSKWFLLVTAFVGVNQWLYVTMRACPASIVLRRTCHLRSAIYAERDNSSTRTEVAR